MLLNLHLTQLYHPGVHIRGDWLNLVIRVRQLKMEVSHAMDFK